MRPSSPKVRFSPGVQLPVAPLRDGGSDLPADIAFLRAYGVSAAVLRRASARAAREVMPASECLIAGGGISALLFYRALADHLGLPFIQSGVSPASGLSAASAIRRGVAPLAPGASRRWLLAPRGGSIALLLRAHRLGLTLPDAFVTTPARFSTLVRRADERAMSAAASDLLPLCDPTLSAKGATGGLFHVAMMGSLGVAGGVAWLAPALAAVVGGFALFAAMSFRLLVCAGGLAAVPDDDPDLADADLPLYTVLVPLYRESGMVDRLVSRLDRIDYPRSKLEIRLLVEADDETTQLACLAAPLGSHGEMIVVPRGALRTKPRALNLALPLARGTLLTVFDAEDAPDPQQLRRAAARFHCAPPELACLQASLTIHNAAAHPLARLFALEYAALFGLFNSGLAARGLPMPLGGTSNHFRTAALHAAGGWDAWNVAEDADLGLRLARFGFATQMLASATSEEAPTDFGNWFRQRRRWTKGWMQTAIGLGRHPGRLHAELGTRGSLAVLLQLTGLVLGPLACVPLTLCGLARLWFTGLPESATWVGWMEATLWGSVFVAGIGATLWPAIVGARRRKMPIAAFSAIPLLLPYQLLIGLAAWGGLFDLLRNPYHWHKTRHGVAARPTLLGRPYRPSRLRKRFADASRRLNL